MRVLVTGGAGFIGSHLVDFLMRNGYQVIAVDNLSSGRLEFISKWFDSDGFEFYRIDLRDFDELVGICRGVDAVFHFALILRFVLVLRGLRIFGRIMFSLPIIC